MSRYRYVDNRFIINDYQNAKTFASFLPAIAGKDGKPLWAFYANVGQVMGGFGVSNKDTPITPFDSATSAYQNIPLRSFRTFIKVDGHVYYPFFHRQESQTMEISPSSVSIKEDNDLFTYQVSYTTVAHRPYAGLIRKVTIKNCSNKTLSYNILDGLPIIFPHGLSNFCYKELVSLMAAYCEISGLDKKRPFIKFKTSTADHSEVAEMHSGNGFYSVDQHNKLLSCIVDKDVVFGQDKMGINPENWEKLSFEEISDVKQQTENKLPCAFHNIAITLKAHEEYSFISLYGMFDSEDEFVDNMHKENYESLANLFIENEKLIKDLVSPMEVKTGDHLFDLYLKQSFFDNNLRGGFPTLLGNKQVYYLFGRKHGDMERDYNSFQIPSTYYSSGSGNFRDVNQNRRSDLYFYPFVKDYNIKLFFSLIQADGQNPLNIKPLYFVKNDDFDEKILDHLTPVLRNELNTILNHYYPSQLYSFLINNKNQIDIDVEAYFSLILANSKQEIDANFAEGYWVDHWTYNVDLLENFVSVYPDKVEELLLRNDYPYFYSPVFVEPRSVKYKYINENKIRQYGAIDLEKTKKECERRHYDLNKTYWLEDSHSNRVYTTLLNKIFSLIIIKYSCLDSYQYGIEMECEKPGWNDAMNGLPGLFASGMSETIELLRLVQFASKYFAQLSIKHFSMLKEQKQFYVKINELIAQFLNKKIGSFTYWDNATKAREEYREAIKECVSGEVEDVDMKSVIDTLHNIALILETGIRKAKDLGNGIIPSYLVYKVSDYELLKGQDGQDIVHVKGFDLVTIPPFLEASARLEKLGDAFFDKKDYLCIKNSDIYDKKLGIYKTCAAIDDAPFEIGRVHAFTKGWLERECDFLHMTYKYLLGLLKVGLYDEFYEEIKKNFPIYMKPEVYGRNPIENSSFIVPTCNPDESKHGQGFFARLTGANAEMMNMFAILFIGENLFEMVDGQLTFHLNPHLHKDLFDDNGEVSFMLFGTTKIIYHNLKKQSTYESSRLVYTINNVRYNEVPSEIAYAIRDGKIKQIDVDIM